jgi:hypothetical protein
VKPIKLTDSEKATVTTIVEQFWLEDQAVRERQVRQWRRLKFMWDGFSQIWWDQTARDWRIWDENRYDDDYQEFYDKPVNIFRAYLETIIAALSVNVPPITCYPDDADNPLDLITARAGDKIAKLVQRHNDVSLLWLHGLFIFCTEGMVACYNYTATDEKYGTYEEKKYEDTTEEHEYNVCTNCGLRLSDVVTTNEERDKFDPDNEDVPLQDYLLNNSEAELCPECLTMMNPEIQRTLFHNHKSYGFCVSSCSSIKRLGNILHQKMIEWLHFNLEAPQM